MRITKIQKRKRSVFRKVVTVVCLVCILGAGFVVFSLSKNKNLIYPIPKSLLIKTVSSKGNVSSEDIKKTEQIRNLTEQLSKENISFSSVEIASQSSLLVYLKDGNKIFFSDKKDISSQISSLQRILSRFTIEGKRFETLDFRFDRPVITLE